MNSIQLNSLARSQETTIKVSHGIARPATSMLQKAVIAEFFPRFCPDAKVVLMKSRDGRPAKLDRTLLNELQITFKSIEDAPDLVAYSESKNCLYFIVTDGGTGPMSHVRRRQLCEAVANSSAGLLFISVFANLNAFKRHVEDIGWNTEVWIKSEPSHSIHWGGREILDLDVTTGSQVKRDRATD